MSKKSFKKKHAGFPPLIYVKKESDGSTQYFVCGEDVTSLPFEVGEGAEVGLYTFNKHVHAEAVVKLGDD
jgi:hypothetical protein